MTACIDSGGFSTSTLGEHKSLKGDGAGHLKILRLPKISLGYVNFHQFSSYPRIYEARCVQQSSNISRICFKTVWVGTASARPGELPVRLCQAFLVIRPTGNMSTVSSRENAVRCCCCCCATEFADQSGADDLGEPAAGHAGVVVSGH